MKALRQIAGILLAAVGLIFSLGCLGNMADDRSGIPRWGWIVCCVTLGLFPLALAFALLRDFIMTPPRSCPKCGGSQHEPAGLLRRTFNPLLFHFAGACIGCLWGASRQLQVRCVICDTLYLTDTRGTRIATVLLWVALSFSLFVAAAGALTQTR